MRKWWPHLGQTLALLRSSSAEMCIRDRNYPGTVGGNWLWRMRPGAADEALAERIRALNARTGRLLRPEKEE